MFVDASCTYVFPNFMLINLRSRDFIACLFDLVLVTQVQFEPSRYCKLNGRKFSKIFLRKGEGKKREKYIYKKNKNLDLANR